MHFALVIAVLSACTKDTAEKKTPESSQSVAEILASMNIQHFTQPVSAPEFELPSVNGEKVSLSQYRGKVVLLSFWATW